MAYAGARFAFSMLEAFQGRNGVVECAYVHSDVVKGTEYFATPVLLGKEGLEKNLGFGELSDYEKEGLEKLLPELNSSIEKGIKFAANASA